jgi:hypothetical protein
LLQFEVGISNDLASLLHSRSSAEIITSRTLLSGDNNFTDAGQLQLVRCHGNEVTLSLSMQHYNVIIYGRLKKNSIFFQAVLTPFIKMEEPLIMPCELKIFLLSTSELSCSEFVECRLIMAIIMLASITSYNRLEKLSECLMLGLTYYRVSNKY